MHTTNKKFIDKKNIIKNQDAHSKLKINKNQQSKNNSVTDNAFNKKQELFSKPYEPQDQYKELTKQFQNAKFDVGYQVFQKAFPFELRTDFISSLKNIEFPAFSNIQLQFNPIFEERQKIEFEPVFEVKQDCFQQFQQQFSTEEEDDQESTEQNSNNLRDKSL